MRKTTFGDVSNWVLNAWKKIKIETIVNGFKKAEITKRETDAEASTSTSSAIDMCSDIDTNTDENTPSSDKDTDTDKNTPSSVLNDSALAAMFVTDTEDEDFGGLESDNDV